MNDLTVSNIERQNVLNNRYAVEVLQKDLGFTGMFFEGEYRFTKKMVADFYEVDERTIERLLEEHSEELKHNGYVLSKGKQLKEFKLQFAPVINVGSKTTRLGLFSFRTVLNVGMLLTESEVAKKVRARILDIVISTINKRAGGGTKYINTRDIDFVTAAIEEDNYRKNFTSAVGRCVQGHKNYKYAQITDLIYHVAAGRIDKDLLLRVINCYMANEDYPEDLKLELIHAIGDQSVEFEESDDNRH